jgi:lipoyl(octanoyl) transferase
VHGLVIRSPGRLPYGEALAAMRAFTADRTPETPDELWIVQHPPVYTVGQAGRAEHLPRGGAGAGIPVEQVDRGGQITYHGPGQAVVYTLVDLARRGMKVRTLVTLLEQAVIDLLAAHGTHATRRTGAPGVYVADAKIAALGLRVRNGRAYHGVALNVDVDLAPFLAIDPCGYPGLAVTRTVDLGISGDCDTLGHALAARIAQSISESS